MKSRKFDLTEDKYRKHSYKFLVCALSQVQMFVEMFAQIYSA